MRACATEGLDKIFFCLHWRPGAIACRHPYRDADWPASSILLNCRIECALLGLACVIVRLVQVQLCAFTGLYSSPVGSLAARAATNRFSSTGFTR